MSSTGNHLRDVGMRLGDFDVLQDVSLDLNARTVAVIWENGSGKSSFARLIGGLATRTSGELSILGIDPSRRAAELRRRIAVVFSNPDAQIIMPTVGEDVAFSLRADKLQAAELGQRVATAMERFGLTHLAERPSHDLSGGQKQLLALCGAFVRNPELVIANLTNVFEGIYQIMETALEIKGFATIDKSINYAADSTTRVMTEQVEGIGSVSAPCQCRYSSQAPSCQVIFTRRPR